MGIGHVRRRRGAAEPVEDAYQAIATIGGWVTNAETKIGLLAAAATVLAGAVVRQQERVELLLRSPIGYRASAALLALAACVAALAVCAGHLFSALRPRLQRSEFSRFAFPDLADADLQMLADPASVQAVRREAWVQARTLARIARAKYQSFMRALVAGIVAGATLVAWLIIAP